MYVHCMAIESVYIYTSWCGVRARCRWRWRGRGDCGTHATLHLGVEKVVPRELEEQVLQTDVYLCTYSNAGVSMLKKLSF